MSDADTLVNLAQLAATRHDQRRQYEWKVSFAFWALLIGSIVKGHYIANYFQDQLIYICLCIFFLYVFVWVRGVWIANHNDKTLSDNFREQAMKKLISNSYQVIEPPDKLSWKSWMYWLGFLCDWSMIFNLLVTLALIVVFYIIQ
ncbi:MAG: hypothetical protein V1871_02040 [Planctomycetota bacterium]